MGNKNLRAARQAKNDEFYTQLEDIEKEMKNYRPHFKDKTIFLNCDDPEHSMFWKFFSLNFDFLGLKRLIATHYDRTEPTYMLEITRGVDLNDDGVHDERDKVITPLKTNGDFRSPECIELLKQSDIVCTNPPFSLFREYIAQLMEYDKKFIIIGNMNAVNYKEVFPLIAAGRLWVGANEKGGTRKGNSLLFAVPDGYEGSSLIEHEGQMMAQVSAWWYTNLDFPKRHEELILVKNYKPEDYPAYDNYDAIECSKSGNIPVDYEESWGIPLDVEVDEDLWEVLYQAKAADDKKRQWIRPADGTDLATKFYNDDDGYIEEITSALEAIYGADNVIYRNGKVGVPISFLNGFYNPEQFDIIGISGDIAKPIIECIPEGDTYQKGGLSFYITDGPHSHKRLYGRIVVRQKKEA